MSTLGFIAAFIYLVRYPGFGNFEGVTGWTSTKQLHEQIIDSNAKKQPLIEQVQSQSVLQLTSNKEALKVGLRLFEDNCAACHGYQAQGSQKLGAPNLTDNVWLYGGKVSDVMHTITYGRQGMMPAHSAMLDDSQINSVANYVVSLSGLAHNEGLVDKGKTIDRKSTRLNSSHVRTSYAVFCLKKKNTPTSTASRIAVLTSSSEAGKALATSLSTLWWVRRLVPQSPRTSPAR